MLEQKTEKTEKTEMMFFRRTEETEGVYRTPSFRPFLLFRLC